MTKRKTDWQGVDWELSNAAIAEQLGVDRTTVAHRRRLLGLGHLTPAERERAATRERIRKLRQAGTPSTRIAKEVGLHPRTVQAIAQEMGLGATPNFYPDRWAIDWEAVDWSLTNRKIAEDHGVHPVTVSRQRSKRRRLGLLPQKEE